MAADFEPNPSHGPLRNWLSGVKHKIIHSDKFFFTLLRSSMSSQVCSYVDMLTAFLAFSLLDFPVWLSTAIGAFIGGILNCIINYKFTFHAKGVEWRAALVKFLFVWTGSMLLNTLGTQGLYSLVTRWDWLHEATKIGDDGIFLAVRLSVSLAVSLCWNFLMQRHFVFKSTSVDPYIYRFLDSIGIGKKTVPEIDDSQNSSEK